MAVIDLERAVFAQRSRAYYVASDNTIRTEQPLARSITLDTNLNGAGATVLASEMLAANRDINRLVETTVEGLNVVSWSDLAGSPPRFNCVLRNITPEAGTTTMPIRVRLDPNSLTTTILHKGSF